MEEKRNSFVFYDSFYNSIKCLKDDKTKLEIFEAICEYALNGEEIEMSDISSMAFNLVKPQIDANNKRYVNGKKGAEYGKLGGRPPKETPSKPQDNPNKTPKKPQHNPKLTPNVNVNDNVNVNVNENVNDNVNVNDIYNNISYGEPKQVFLSLVLNDGSNFDIDTNLINEMKELYPAVDVEQEFRNMKGWCLSNQQNRKTRNGIKRFINGWLSRKQNQAPVRTDVVNDKVEEKKNDDWLTDEEIERIVKEFNGE